MKAWVESGAGYFSRASHIWGPKILIAIYEDNNSGLKVQYQYEVYGLSLIAERSTHRPERPHHESEVYTVHNIIEKESFALLNYHF